MLIFINIKSFQIKLSKALFQKKIITHFLPTTCYKFLNRINYFISSTRDQFLVNASFCEPTEV